jgi:serralysin
MSDKLIKVCVDQMFETHEDVLQAMDLAVEENPANLLDAHQKLAVGQPPEARKLALLIGKKWKPGGTLRVRFLDGDPQVQDKVEQVAHQWSDFANIKFDFGTHQGAQIRISFAHEGSWSYIGTDALSPRILPDQPTMNFGWLDPGDPDDEYNRVVLHEFGHALGCVHEHSHPQHDIPWNKEKVYAYYARHGWSKEKVDRNLFRKYSRTQTQFSAFDPKSIMIYSIPKELTDGIFEVAWNQELSAMDKAFIGTAYPF